MITENYDVGFYTQRYVELLIEQRFPSYKVNNIEPWQFCTDGNLNVFVYNSSVVYFGYVFSSSANNDSYVSLNGCLMSLLATGSTRDADNNFTFYAGALPSRLLLFDTVNEPETQSCDFVGWKITFDNFVSGSFETPISSSVNLPTFLLFSSFVFIYNQAINKIVFRNPLPYYVDSTNIDVAIFADNVTTPFITFTATAGAVGQEISGVPAHTTLRIAYKDHDTNSFGFAQQIDTGGIDYFPFTFNISGSRIAVTSKQSFVLTSLSIYKVIGSTYTLIETTDLANVSFLSSETKGTYYFAASGSCFLQFVIVENGLSFSFPLKVPVTL